MTGQVLRVGGGGGRCATLAGAGYTDSAAEVGRVLLYAVSDQEAEEGRRGPLSPLSMPQQSLLRPKEYGTLGGSSLPRGGAMFRADRGKGAGAVVLYNGMVAYACAFPGPTEMADGSGRVPLRGSCGPVHAL